MRKLYSSPAAWRFDVAIAYDLYRSAVEKGLGQKLLLWDEPYLK